MNKTINNRTLETIKVIEISPFTNYTCSVSAATMAGDGPPATVSGVSDEDGECAIHNTVIVITISMFCTVPAGPPRQVVNIAKTSTSISVSWIPPATPNGVITEYQLQCSSHEQSFNHSVNGSQTAATLNGLLPYTNYSCNITARNSAGEGPAATASVATKQYCEQC